MRDYLRNQGFDKSERDENGEWRVRCSQCEALVINGVACHEAGCPNKNETKGNDNE